MESLYWEVLGGGAGGRKFWKLGCFELFFGYEKFGLGYGGYKIKMEVIFIVVGWCVLYGIEVWNDIWFWS